MAERGHVAQPGGEPARPRGDRRRELVHGDVGRHVARGKQGGDPEGLVLVAVEGRRPWAVRPVDPLGPAQERRKLLAGQPRDADAQGRDTVRVGAVARLVQAGVPGAQEAFARAAPERLGEQVVEERGEDELGGDTQQSLP